MTSFKMTGKEYNKIKEAHRSYLATYAALNNGSLEGAVPLRDFYFYKTYTSKYADPRACSPMGYG